jgi:hypothetical protein
MADEATTFSSLNWWQKLFSQSPAMAILLAIIATGSMGWWVFRSTYDEMKTERNEYRQLSLDAIRELETATIANSRSNPAAARPVADPTPAAAPARPAAAAAENPMVRRKPMVAKPRPTPDIVVVNVDDLKNRANVLDSRKKQ